MKKFIVLILSLLIIIAGCGVTKPNIPGPEQNTTVHVIDSIAWHDSTIFHIIPKEIYNDYTDLLDTLKLDTSYSEFESWVDTTNNTLKGKAKNKIDKIPVQTKWKEKIVYKDSIKIVKEPYPVEVEKIVHKHYWYEKILWFFSIIGLAAIVIICIKLYVKFKL